MSREYLLPLIQLIVHICHLPLLLGKQENMYRSLPHQFCFISHNLATSAQHEDTSIHATQAPLTLSVAQSNDIQTRVIRLIQVMRDA